MSNALLVANDLNCQAAFGNNHPLSIPRIEKVMGLCRVMGWLDPGWLRSSPIATEEQLGWFHASDYVRALRESDQQGRVSRQDRERFGFGTMENPLFPGVFERASTAVGGSIRSAELALTGRIVFHPAGGTHHAAPDRARGFCYFNDPVFAILRFLRAGLVRVLYIDLDAHHGDGVQYAFQSDDRVRTISLHEANRWPYTGLADDTGDGFACNIPVPSGFNDTELEAVHTQLFRPLIRSFSPQAIVLTCGADACSSDPLSTMALSNRSLWAVSRDLAQSAPAVVVVGGGGYNPWTLTRYWAGLWATLSGQPLINQMPRDVSCVFEGLDCDLLDDDEINPAWMQFLFDEPNCGPIRPETRRVLDAVTAGIRWHLWQPLNRVQKEAVQ